MTATLLDRLARELAQHGSGHGTRQTAAYGEATAGFVVALSGGVDSVTLLAAMRRLGLDVPVRAVHVDHGLHPDSGNWAEFCRSIARRLGVDLQVRAVDCSERAGESPEAVARAARYAAFAEMLQADEVLLSAHHADDQLETQLYRLLRGTGVDGLRGVRTVGSVAGVRLVRPFIACTRAQILDQAQQWGLEWLEDPANDDQRFDRNFLRHGVLPGLRARWPGAAHAAVRLAAAAQDSAELTQALAELDLRDAGELDCLPLAAFGGLSEARRRNMLRYATRSLALPLPDAEALERIVALTFDDSTAASAAWPGAQAHRHAGSLYLRTAGAALRGSLPLLPDQQCVVGDGELTLVPSDAPALPASWVRAGLQVRFRSGGERFHAAGSARGCELREWMRVNGLLPWMRDRIPLVFCGEELVAVADLGLSAAASAASQNEGGWRVVWRDRPRTH